MTAADAQPPAATFAGVVGHDAAVARLRRAADENRPAQAYLVTGPPGVGKHTLARAFAARLLCVAPAAGDACGTCGQCVRVTAGTHPDLRAVAREEDRRDIRTEQARDVTRWLALRPLMASRKVVVIDEAECLNEQGQNALLKTLEEPPGGAVLLLVATRAAQLLPTVRSRCQHVRLDALATEDVARFLADRGVDAARVPILAARAEGAPGRALQLLDDPDAAMRSALLERLPEIAQFAAADCSALAQQLAKGATTTALALMIGWYRDLVALAVSDDPAAVPLRNPDAAPALHAAAARTPGPDALRQLEAVCDTAVAVERNANKQLALETLLLVLRRLARGDGLPAAWTTRP